MLQLLLHCPSSTSMVSAQYNTNLCPNPSFSSKSSPFNLASQPSSLSFSLGRRKTLSVKCRQPEFFDPQNLTYRPTFRDSSNPQEHAGSGSSSGEGIISFFLLLLLPPLNPLSCLRRTNCSA